MSIEVLLDLIRQKFSPTEGQTLVLSLQQDPLVWQFAQDEKNIAYFKSAPKILDAFSPGKIALWLIQQETGTILDNPNDLKSSLPTDLRQHAAQTFETIFNTGLPPTDLFTAGLIALTLRERRILKGSWRGISSEILLKRSKLNLQKNLQIWRTPFACLHQLCPDYNDLVMDFLGTKPEVIVSTSIPIFIHALLANPLGSQTQLEHLSSLSKTLTIDAQLEVLKWLDAFNRNELRLTLAKHMIQTKPNIDFFAKVFSELEAFESQGDAIDALAKKVRYTLAEDLNRLAAFNLFSGNAQKAREFYYKSSELLDFVKSQTLYQSLASDPDVSTDSDWSKLLKFIPESRQAHLMHIQILIKQGKNDEAANYLEAMPESVEKGYLQYKLNDVISSKHSPSITVETPSLPDVDPWIQMTAYYAQTPKMDITRDIFQTLKDTNDLGKSLEIAEKYLEGTNYDPHIIELIRDIYIKAHQSDEAINLTSYLNLIEPENIQHRRTLASLYIQSERWRDAFATLQNIIKTESEPRIKDLVYLAKSAMKTEHVDMAISICQNILHRVPNNTQALVLLGEGYMIKGDSVKAIQHMEQVVEMIPDEAETWLTLARLWRENDQPDRAFEILNKGILAIPNDAKLLHALGKTYLKKQAPADAQTCLKKAIQFAPDNIKIKLDLAHAEYQLGNYESARALLEPFINTYEQDPSIAKLLGLVLLAMEENNTAEPILLFAAKNLPEDMDTLLTGIRLSLERIEASCEGASKVELDELNQLLNNALHKNKNDARIHLHLADIARLNGNHQEAFDAYLKLSEKDQNQTITADWRFSYGLGQTAIALDDYDIGLAALQEANSMQPDNLIVIHALAEAYQFSGLNEKAQKTGKSALKMAPQDIHNILWYANFKTKNHEPQEAVRALKEALQISPDRSDLKFWLAKSLFASGDIQGTHEHIASVISDSKATPEQLHQTAYLCVQINALDLAVQALEKANQHEPDMNPILLMDLALCHSLQGHRKKALEVLNLNEDWIIPYPELSMFKSDLLSELGQYDLAFKTLSVIEDYVENNLSIMSGDDSEHSQRSPLLYPYDFSLKGYHYRLGQLLRVRGEIKQSQTHFTQALDLAQDDIQTRNACVEAYLAGLDFEHALSICEGINDKRLGSNQKGQNYLDIFSNQVEILINQNYLEDANTLFTEHLSNAVCPRVLAIKSQLANERGEIESAREYLNQAIDTYTKDWNKDNITSLNAAIRNFVNLNNIAEAAMHLEDHQKALDFHNQAAALFDNQPYQNWQHVKALMKAAQAQQIANLLSIKTHAPGAIMLSGTQYSFCQTLLEKITPYLPEQQAVCLKAQCVASYTGKWPLSLNINACLTTPDIAALIVMSCDDEELVQDIIDSYPDNIKVLQASGLHALGLNKDIDPVYIEKALQLDVSNPVNHALLALLNRDMPELALNSLETALGFWPDEPEWHALAGELYHQLGDTKSAAHHITCALETQPENAAYWQKSAEIKIRGNQFQEAKEDLAKSAAYQSDDAHIWVKMADVNRRLGNISEALQNIKTASNLAPDDKEVALQEIQYLLEQKQFIEAENKAKVILGKEGMDQEARVLLARAQAKQGKFDLALEGLEADTKNQNVPAILLERIKIIKDRNGTETALPKLISLAQNYPQDPDILTTLTDYLIQTNRLKEAEEAAQTILRIVPEQAEVHLMLGRLQRKTGQLDQAIAHLSDAIQYSPTLIEAYLELGKTYQERRDLEQAITVFQKGTQADSTDPRPYFHAGMALKDCKDYASAEAMLKQAKRYAPEDPIIIRQLGVVTALNLVNNLRETRQL